MWYFAYGSNINVRAVAEWCRQYGFKCPLMKPGSAAVVDNYRLCFSVFSEYWGGGIADIVYDPGKYVAGALFELTKSELDVLDEKVVRQVDSSGKEIGLYKQIEVTANPLGQKSPVKAITYQGITTDKLHIPPTSHYMESVIQGAYGFGLSMMWISYLQSFSTHTGKKPKRPAAR